MKKLTYYAILNTITFLTFLGLLILSTAAGAVMMLFIEIVSELLGAFFFNNFEYEGFGFEVKWFMARFIGFIGAVSSTYMIYKEGNFPQWTQDRIDEF